MTWKTMIDDATSFHCVSFFLSLSVYAQKMCIFPGETLSSDLRFRRKGEIKKVPLKYEIRKFTVNLLKEAYRGKKSYKMM